MSEPIFLSGFVIFIGAIMALSARSLGLPAATGALVGGAGLAWAARAGGIVLLPPPAGDGSVLLRLLALAFLSFLLGAEIDLARLAKMRVSLGLTALAQAAAVMGAVVLAALLLGLDAGAALLIGAAAIAASPPAAIAVAGEARARGVLAQRLLVLSSASIVIALIAVRIVDAALRGPSGGVLGDIGTSLLFGLGCGILLLIPLSRMAKRSSILTCVGVAALLLAGAAAGPAPGQHLALIGIVAGFLAGNFIPTRDLVREALRDVALPAAVIYFTLSATTLIDAPLALMSWTAAGIVAARGLGLSVAGIIMRGETDGLREASALIPTGGFLIAAPLFQETLAADPILTPLLGAMLLSEAGGMIGTRWALNRAGEAPGPTDDPDAWRAPMR